MQDALEENLGATECEFGNVEVRWNSIRKCVLDTVGDFTGEVNRNTRKQWISQGMVNKMSQRGKLKNVKTKNEGRKKYRILRNELKNNIIYLLTAIWLSPGGSGYFTCKQNMKLVTNKFKSGGLHEKHVVATWNHGNRLSICL